jgi:uncharacterized membrane protein YcaP (DUF421 family)
MFFESWAAVGRTLLVGMLAYLAVVCLLRVSGKRTLTQKDPFDFVVAAALGSALAQVLLVKEVALASGVLGFAVLIGLQHGVARLSVWQPRVRQLIKAEPTLRFYDGAFLRQVMAREHIHEVEILAAVREQGIAALEEVQAVVLEANSGISVIRRSGRGTLLALADVDPRPPPAARGYMPRPPHRSSP